ncbi:nuclear factor 7, brain-like [Salarias fasciatus]|uniref:Nuclear factor 7, brain-like n=1 Tax=Salarias fasciatus TaxID=181472 RepID=A0A672I6K0_SALFA|nr:nuclear factor 7, brain-like [Salarias fasciatus]
MATARPLMTEDQFLCSICLSVFTQPVSIPCGHNFCLKCITDYWDTQTVFKCPNCTQDFYPKPMLSINIFIADIAENFKKSAEPVSPGSPEEPENGDVLCDRCTGPQLTAVKSCLVCFMSFCQTHLEPHQRIPTLKKHKLVPAAKNLESRICEHHHEPLDLFCRVEQMFLCEKCQQAEHKNHKTVTLEEEAEMRKIQLVLEKRDAVQMMQARQQKILEIQQSVGASRNNADQALSCSQHVVTAMVDYMKKSLSELTEVIEARKRKSGTEALVIINELEKEIMVIKGKNRQLEAVSLSNDPFTFMENFLSFNINSPQVKDWSDVALKEDQYTIEGAMEKLQTTIRREISMLCDPDFKEKQKHAVDVTLDADTANPTLRISEDGKQVTHVNRKVHTPNRPQRFDLVLNVLGKEGFSSGKFYYEVQVKDKTQWDLGVANQSINRKGDIRLSPKTGYWTIWLRKGIEFTANAGPAISLHVREIPQKIGVFVDYEGGEVSFYDVDARALIFSFTQCNFTEKLFPFFSPCSNDGGKNSAPLIITPVEHNG